RLDAAEASVSDGLLLPAVGAVILGGTSLRGGAGGIGGTVIGALLMTVIINGMNLLGVPSFWQPLVVGVIILASVGLDRLSRAVGVVEEAAATPETGSGLSQAEA